jgi:outer membrane protein assembly factor BamB
MVLTITIPQNGTRSKLDVTALEIPTGKVLWESGIDDKADLFPAEKASRFFPKMDLSSHAEPTFDEEAVYFAYAGLHKMDLATGKLLWKNAYDVTEKSFRKNNASPVVDGGTVYTSAKGQIRAFDRASGALKWTSQDFGAGVAQMMARDGVLYGRMGGVFYEMNKREFQKKKPLGVVALDAATGGLNWRYDGAQDSITNMAVLPEAKSVLIADSKSLIGLSMDASGKKVKEEFKVPLEFKAKGGAGKKIGRMGFGALRGGAIGAIAASGGGPGEPPIGIIRREDGRVIVRSTQHILAFDPARREIAWTAQFEAPGMSMFAKIATSAVFAMMYAMETQKAASTYAGTSENRWANANRRKIIDNWTAVLEKRYKKSAATNNFAYMLTDVRTDQGKGPGIVGVNLATGAAERQVLFGDKEPEYVIDEVNGVVFRTHKNGKEITALQVE